MSRYITKTIFMNESPLVLSPHLTQESLQFYNFLLFEELRFTRRGN